MNLCCVDIRMKWMIPEVIDSEMLRWLVWLSVQEQAWWVWLRDPHDRASEPGRLHHWTCWVQSQGTPGGTVIFLIYFLFSHHHHRCIEITLFHEIYKRTEMKICFVKEGQEDEPSFPDLERSGQNLASFCKESKCLDFWCLRNCFQRVWGWVGWGMYER